MGITRRTFSFSSLVALFSGLFFNKQAKTNKTQATPSNTQATATNMHAVANPNHDTPTDHTESPTKQQSKPMNEIKNLVFRGGGPLAFSYIGAVEVLDEQGKLAPIERTTGSSAGALFATLVALNMTPAEIRDFMFSIKNPSMGLITDLKIPHNLFTHYGMLSTDYIIDPLEKLLKEKTGNKHITFSQLREMGKFKELYVVTTDLSTTSSLTFSHEHKELDIPISLAVSASNSLPLAYMSVELDINGKNHVLVDGGVMRNFPIDEFDLPAYCADDAIERPGRPGMRVNPSTLGFFSDVSNPKTRQPVDERPYREITNLLTFVKTIPIAMFDVQGNMLVENQADVKRTVFIENPNYDVSKGYEQTPEVKEEMVASGRAGTLEYLKAAQVKV